jgi:hypothetical protein
MARHIAVVKVGKAKPIARVNSPRSPIAEDLVSVPGEDLLQRAVRMEFDHLAIPIAIVALIDADSVGFDRLPGRFTARRRRK